MSNAERKARKRRGEQFQHPTREGIPYGNSKQPDPMRALPSYEEIIRTKVMIEAAKEWWPR